MRAPFTSTCGTDGLLLAVQPHLAEDVPLLRVAPHRLLELGNDAASDLPGVLFGAQTAVGEDGRADVGEVAAAGLARRPAEDDRGAADPGQAGRAGGGQIG